VRSCKFLKSKLHRAAAQPLLLLPQPPLRILLPQPHPILPLAPLSKPPPPRRPSVRDGGGNAEEADSQRWQCWAGAGQERRRGGGSRRGVGAGAGEADCGGGLGGGLQGAGSGARKKEIGSFQRYYVKTESYTSRSRKNKALATSIHVHTCFVG
jgi:hypothetical protein